MELKSKYKIQNKDNFFYYLNVDIAVVCIINNLI